MDKQQYFFEESRQAIKHEKLAFPYKIFETIALIALPILILFIHYNGGSKLLLGVLSVCLFILLINAFIFLRQKCKDNYSNRSHKWYFFLLLLVDFAGLFNTIYLINLICELCLQK